MAQPTLLDIGEPLHATTFVVIDLETTGASARTSAITEIGAVKTRGGEVIGEFQTLVDPGTPIPPMIVALTGITDAMVLAAPRIEAVLPALIEFIGDAVVVAHNAPFDVGFLKAAYRAHGYRWAGNQVVDTVVLARRATTKEEAPNKKLATLARVFGSPTTPNHRALDDARATAHVLHGMLERLARFGITHREDLESLRNAIPESLRKKATMADAVPSAPGVYVFRGPRGEWLYVGTSRNLRSRVKSYFTKAEQRRSMRDMLTLATSVDTYVVPTGLEAAVLEIRFINDHRPRYNRRSARPERTPWLRLTDERYPRASLTRSASAVAEHAIGPMRGSFEASLAAEVLQVALGVRTCTTRLPVTPRTNARACLLMDLGSCSAPCVRGEASGYDEVAARAHLALEQDPSTVVSVVEAHIADLSERLEYERAARLRDGLSALIAGAIRAERLRSLAHVRLIATRRSAGAWDVVSIAGGALTGSARVERGVWEVARALQEGWDEVPGSVLVEERELVLAWLEQADTRLLVVEGEWTQSPLGAGRHHRWVEAKRSDHAHVNDLMRDAVRV
jgi:DNA polymerase-3 subunit epsilon